MPETTNNPQYATWKSCPLGTPCLKAQQDCVWDCRVLSDTCVFCSKQRVEEQFCCGIPLVRTVGYYRIAESERFGLEGFSKIIKFQPHGQGHLTLGLVAQSTIQPGLETFQECGIHNLCGQHVPVLPHLQSSLPLTFCSSSF